MTDQPTKAMLLIERRRMQNLGAVEREIWIDKDDQIWWRLVNSAAQHESEYTRGDPR